MIQDLGFKNILAYVIINRKSYILIQQLILVFYHDFSYYCLLDNSTITSSSSTSGNF